jgi:Uma2 family endonuclease
MSGERRPYDGPVAERAESVERWVDYPHLEGEPDDPLMEGSLHSRWVSLLVTAVDSALADVDVLVTGNTPILPSDGGPQTAPDLMVIPGMRGRDIGRYVIGPGDPMPTVCLEVLSPSNWRPGIRRRVARFLRLGVPEVYVLDPVHHRILEAVGDGSTEEYEERSMLGRRSERMNVTWVMRNGALALCCPGGRAVGINDDPYGWLLDETVRADAEAARADALAEELRQMREAGGG